MDGAYSGDNHLTFSDNFHHTSLFDRSPQLAGQAPEQQPGESFLEESPTLAKTVWRIPLLDQTLAENH